MTELIVNKKKFIIISRKEYESLQKKAALKSKPEKTFSLIEARAYSKTLIRKWAKESHCETIGGKKYCRNFLVH